jgi:hypothetical protein
MFSAACFCAVVSGQVGECRLCEGRAAGGVDTGLELVRAGCGPFDAAEGRAARNRQCHRAGGADAEPGREGDRAGNGGVGDGWRRGEQRRDGGEPGEDAETAHR